ncbi:MAG: hypothetical protein F6K41_17450 [Symploca sp. SIO3E6]|nr:hypothetical protein [Caldora sp. SIO3E6]
MSEKRVGSGGAEERRSRGVEERRSGGAEERRSGGAEERRSGGAEERRSGGAEERRSGGAEERRKKRELIIFGYLARKSQPKFRSPGGRRQEARDRRQSR